MERLNKIFCNITTNVMPRLNKVIMKPANVTILRGTVENPVITSKESNKSLK